MNETFLTGRMSTNLRIHTKTNVIKARRWFVEKVFSMILVWLLPIVISAQTIRTPQNFSELVNKWIGLINIVVGWLIIICGVIFMNGFIFYFAGGGDQERVAEGKKRMYFGFLGLFILFSWWGIAKLLKVSTFG